MTETSEISREDFRVITPLRVRYHEADMQNIVFNANYLVYADIASTDYFRALNDFANPGESHKTMELFENLGGEIMARHADVDFRAPAKFDDVLDLAVRTSRIGKSSFTLQTAMMKEDKIINLVHVTYVYFDMKAQKSAALPNSIRDIITNFERVAPSS